jgi:hypothetical protein
MARDLGRALDWLEGHDVTLLRPELNVGGRLLGPVFYWIVALVWLVARSVPRTLQVLHAGTIVLLLALFIALVKDRGWYAAMLFLLTAGLMPSDVMLDRTLWNPSLIEAVNVGCVLCTRDYARVRNERALYALCALGWVGLQIHMSTLVGLVACGWVAWGYAGCRDRRRILLLAITLLAYAGVVTVATGNAGQLASGIHEQFASRPLLGSRLTYLASWRYHLFLQQQPIRNDYNVFPLLFAYGHMLYPRLFAGIGWFAALAPGFIVMFLAALAAVLVRAALPRRHAGSRDVYERLLAPWAACALVPLFFYTVKDGSIPYRYGASVYPVHMLVVPIGVGLLSELRWLGRLRLVAASIVLGFAAMIFVGNGAALLAFYRVMERTGRAYQSAGDNLEFALRYKQAAIGAGRALEPAADPFSYLHGAIIKKIRLEEYNCCEPEYYGSLARVTPPQPTPPLSRRHYWAP